VKQKWREYNALAQVCRGKIGRKLTYIRKAKENNKMLGENAEWLRVHVAVVPGNDKSANASDILGQRSFIIFFYRDIWFRVHFIRYRVATERNASWRLSVFH